VRTIKVCSKYPGLDTYNGKSIISGFHTHKYKIPEFTVVAYLGLLGLGFFNDITVPIYRGGLEILFTRNNDENVIYRWKTEKVVKENAASLSPEGKITIKSFYLRVTIIKYNSEP
jgi:hypothetical protein